MFHKKGIRFPLGQEKLSSGRIGGVFVEEGKTNNNK
jgi:hypothetical protein